MLRCAGNAEYWFDYVILTEYWFYDLPTLSTLAISNLLRRNITKL